jgi:hypothetical protein
MARQAQAEHLKKWDMALAGAEANAGEPGVEDLKVELGTAAEGARAKLARKNQLEYQLQQTFRELDEIMSIGKKTYARLVRVIKGRFGRDSEKLREWGVQPERPPQVSLVQKVTRFLERKEKENEKPSEPGVAPARTADSQTESTS